MNDMMTQEIKKRVGSILQQAGVKRSAVFGSYARGEQNAKSDIDILVEFQGKKTLLNPTSKIAFHANYKLFERKLRNSTTNTPRIPRGG